MPLNIILPVCMCFHHVCVCLILKSNTTKVNANSPLACQRDFTLTFALAPAMKKTKHVLYLNMQRVILCVVCLV